MSKRIETTVESDFDNNTYVGILGMVQHWKKQIQHYIDDGSCKDIEYANIDISGYNLLLEANSEKNAREFLKLKHSHLEKDSSIKEFKDNMENIDYMKKNDLWRESD